MYIEWDPFILLITLDWIHASTLYRKLNLILVAFSFILAHVSSFYSGWVEKYPDEPSFIVSSKQFILFHCLEFFTLTSL